MAKQHSATPEQWALVRRRAHHPEFSTILELRDRIEALEARNEDDKETWAAMRRANISAALHIEALMRRIDALEAASTEARPTVKARITRDRDETGDYLIIHDLSPNHPAKPDSSLVGRVAAAITGDGDEPINWKPEARAAIREVAAWLRDHYGGTTASTDLLEQEAER